VSERTNDDLLGDLGFQVEVVKAAVEVSELVEVVVKVELVVTVEVVGRIEVACTVEVVVTVEVVGRIEVVEVVDVAGSSCSRESKSSGGMRECRCSKCRRELCTRCSRGSR
jgi:hypothetical protein